MMEETALSDVSFEEEEEDAHDPPTSQLQLQEDIRMVTVNEIHSAVSVISDPTNQTVIDPMPPSRPDSFPQSPLPEEEGVGERSSEKVAHHLESATEFRSEVVLSATEPPPLLDDTEKPDSPTEDSGSPSAAESTPAAMNSAGAAGKADPVSTTEYAGLEACLYGMVHTAWDVLLQEQQDMGLSEEDRDGFHNNHNPQHQSSLSSLNEALTSSNDAMASPTSPSTGLAVPTRVLPSPRTSPSHASASSPTFRPTTTSHSSHHVTSDEWDLRPPGLWKTDPPHPIALGALRKLASRGIPDEGSHRAVTWRVLLEYLPPSTAAWAPLLQEKRQWYQSLVVDWFGPLPDIMTDGHELRGQRRRRPPKPSISSSTPPPTAAAAASTASSTSPPPPTTTTGPDSEASAELGAWPATPHLVSTEEEEEEGTEERPPASAASPPELPAAVQRYWRKQGRDMHVLQSLTKGLNALQFQHLPTVQVVEDGSASESSSSAGSGNKKVLDMTSEENRPWLDFMESAVLLDEIRKDVIRTHPDSAFYLDPDRNVGKRRYAALERILFVWSKYNQGVRYVQGMNEIVGTLYYVMANDRNVEWASEAEADTYWLFTMLMADLRDVFVPDLDDADTGITGRINNMQALLGQHDPEVKEHLEEMGIDASFYAIRWWTTLLSREFLLPDTIRLWDSLFASTHKDNFLRYVCVTMVMMIRDDLLKGDFSSCLRLLQAYPPIPVDPLLESTRALWIYESQVTVACHKGGVTLHQALQAITPPPALIIAFGVPRGTVTRSRSSEAWEAASEKAAATLREATSTMATHAQGWLGRASRLYSKYRRTPSSSSGELVAAPATSTTPPDSEASLGATTSQDETEMALPDVEDIYMNAILNA